MSADTSDPIKRVVLLMLENHSFDQMLGSLSSVYPDLDGIPQTGAMYSNSDSSGKVYYQERSSEMQMELDPDHDNGPVLRQLEDGNSGFIKDFVRKYPKSTEIQRKQIMGYYEFPFLPALHTLADNFVVCDRWFSSLPGPTWPNRFFALSGTSSGHVRMPAGLLSPDIQGFFEQTQTTIFDRLDDAGKEWKVFYYDVASSWVLVNQRSAAHLDRYATVGLFFDDAASGHLADFVFIEPKYYGQDQNDAHPPHNIMKSEKLIADVYNAIRTSPQWEETLLVVVYDEHGGFYDHVPPPPAVAPDEHTEEYAFDRLGVRVPAILVSPWLARGVDHHVFDHTSFLRYVSDKWNLGPLGARVAQANSIQLAMNFLPAARINVVPSVRVRNSDLYAPHPDLEVFDRNAHHAAFSAFGDFLSKKGSSLAGTSPASHSKFAAWSRIFLDLARGYVGRRLIRWGYALGNNKQSVAAEVTQLTKAVEASANDRQVG